MFLRVLIKTNLDPFLEDSLLIDEHLWMIDSSIDTDTDTNMTFDGNLFDKSISMVDDFPLTDRLYEDLDLSMFAENQVRLIVHFFIQFDKRTALF